MKKVIEFSHATKDYFLQEDRTFKELIPNILMRRPISRSYKALKGVSFEIEQGETVGIIGKNGAGKSTVLKLIAGVTYPSKGTVKVHGRVAPIIELGAGFHHELSGFENIFLNAAILGMHKKEIELKIDEIIEFSELKEFIHVPVKKYSTGMQMRLAFAVAVHMDAPILLIDEVLAVGDADFQEKCLNKLEQLKKQHDKTIVFVSHNEDAVTSFCERAILLEHGEVIAQGKTKDVFEIYHNRKAPNA